MCYKMCLNSHEVLLKDKMKIFMIRFINIVRFLRIVLCFFIMNLRE